MKNKLLFGTMVFLVGSNAHAGFNCRDILSGKFGFFKSGEIIYRNDENMIFDLLDQKADVVVTQSPSKSLRIIQEKNRVVIELSNGYRIITTSPASNLVELLGASAFRVHSDGRVNPIPVLGMTTEQWLGANGWNLRDPSLEVKRVEKTIPQDTKAGEFKFEEYPLLQLKDGRILYRKVGQAPQMLRPNTGPRPITGVLLPDGKALFVGTIDKKGSLTTLIEIVDPRTGESTVIGELKELRANATLTVLPEGKVRVDGGQGPNRQTSEVIDLATGESTISSL